MFSASNNAADIKRATKVDFNSYWLSQAPVKMIFFLFLCILYACVATKVHCIIFIDSDGHRRRCFASGISKTDPWLVASGATKRQKTQIEIPTRSFCHWIAISSINGTTHFEVAVPCSRFEKLNKSIRLKTTIFWDIDNFSKTIIDNVRELGDTLFKA